MIDVSHLRVELPSQCGKEGAGVLMYRPDFHLDAEGRSEDAKVIEEVWTEDNYHLRTIWREHATIRVLDCGAHIGTFSSLVLALYPNARIWAFEPNDENRTLFEANVQTGPAVRLFPDAVGAVGEDGLLLGEGATGRITPLRSTSAGGAGITIRPLREIIEAFAWGAPADRNEVDLLKLDIEGGEYEALAACPARTLALVGRIAMEWHGFESHPWIDPGSYGKLVEQLAETHTVQAFGRPAAGGMLYATRY